MKRKLVCGVGVYATGEYVSYVDDKISKEYNLWATMLKRCYSEKYHVNGPSYIGCSVSEGFKEFQVFAAWSSKQIGFGAAGFQLDKDIIFKGNKVYSEETCVFVPREINLLLAPRVRNRGKNPPGVCEHACGKFRAKLNDRYLGLFSTPDAAFAAYKVAKEAHIKVVAEQFKHQIDERAYAALMAYQVNIDD